MRDQVKRTAHYRNNNIYKEEKDNIRSSKSLNHEEKKKEAKLIPNPSCQRVMKMKNKKNKNKKLKLKQ